METVPESMKVVNIHGSPVNILLRSDCVYDRDEVVYIRCWLYYVYTGNSKPRGWKTWEEDTTSGDEASEGEYSPYHVHS